MKTASFISIAFLVGGGLHCSKRQQELRWQAFDSQAELFSALAEHSQAASPPADAESQIWIQLGKNLFHDASWSRQQRSCAECHLPKQDSSGAKLQGVTQSFAPALVNLSHLRQYGRVGQYASVLDAVAAMILSPDFTDLDVPKLQAVLSAKFTDPVLGKILPLMLHTSSQIQQKTLPARIIAKAYASLKNRSLKAAFNQMLTNDNLLTEETMQRILRPTTSSDVLASIDPDENAAAAITMASYALSSYILSIESYDSAFDKFAREAISHSNIDLALNEQFSVDEWQGFLVFRKASCHNCHSGPNFSRGLAFNVGAPRTTANNDESPTDPLNGLLFMMGQAARPLYPQYIDYSCKQDAWRILAKTLLNSSCEELIFPGSDTEAIGAYKTPSLRNLDRETTTTYHQDNLAAIGELSPLLSREKLDSEEEENLRRFLASLTNTQKEP